MGRSSIDVELRPKESSIQLSVKVWHSV